MKNILCTAILSYDLFVYISGRVFHFNSLLFPPKQMYNFLMDKAEFIIGTYCKDI